MHKIVCLRNPWEKYSSNVAFLALRLLLEAVISLFLKRDVNKAFARVTGSKINRGAGYGLEIPYVYEFYGPRPYIDKLREVILPL